MSYQPVNGEVFYCGNCKRQQETSRGISCISCQKPTVSWYTNRESSADAQRKWNSVNGKR